MVGGRDAVAGSRTVGSSAIPAWLAAGAAALLGVVALAVGVWGAATGPEPAVATGPALTTVTTGPTATTAATTAATGVAAPGADAAVPSGGVAAGAAVAQPEVGQCLAVRGSTSGSTVVVVACTSAHHFEVAALVDAGPAFRSAPTDVEWRALLSARCPERMRAYVGDSYDPAGVLRLRVSAPSATEWAAGDHRGECLLAVGEGHSGLPEEIATPVAAIDQSPPAPVGSCLRWDPLSDAAAVAVPCQGPHQLQVVAPFDLTGRAEHYPDATQWAQLDRACADPVAARHGAAMRAPSGNPLQALVVRVPVGSWLAGRRDTACAVAEIDLATGRLVTSSAVLPG